jgi:hypothetical protein
MATRYQRDFFITAALGVAVIIVIRWILFHPLADSDVCDFTRPSTPSSRSFGSYDAELEESTAQKIALLESLHQERLQLQAELEKRLESCSSGTVQGNAGSERPRRKRIEPPVTCLSATQTVNWLVQSGVLVPASHKSKPRKQSWTMQEFLDGELRTAAEPPLRAVTAADLKKLRAHSECQNKERSRTDVVQFCTVARNRVKITLEWVLWHYALGGSDFVVFDDVSEDGLAIWLKPLVDFGIVRIEKLPYDPLEKRRMEQPGTFLGRNVTYFGRQLTARSRCIEIARENARRRGAPATRTWVAMLHPEEFVHSEQCFPRALEELMQRVNGSQQAIGAVALPIRRVGNFGAYVDKDRHVFEGTEFAAGVGTTRFKSIVLADAVAPFERMKPNLHALEIRPPLRTVFFDGASAVDEATGKIRTADPTYRPEQPRIVKYFQRSFAAILRKMIDYPRYPADAAPLPELHFTFGLNFQLGAKPKMSTRLRNRTQILLEGLGLRRADDPQPFVELPLTLNDVRQNPRLLSKLHSGLWIRLSQGASFGRPLVSQLIQEVGIAADDAFIDKVHRKMFRVLHACSEGDWVSLRNEFQQI